ncbi:MAG TPA: sugar ABC transporter substrate-binding protein [Solirubrobacter sp.]|nr:sugar ABC transporter substrate-binding protein [Solirubrobacter sp.]
MRVNRWRAAAVVAVAVPLVVAACGGESNDDQPSSARAASADLRLYAVIHGNANDLYWAQFRKGVEDASKQVGVTTKLLATEQFSVQKYVDLLNSAIAAKPDGLIASIPDVKAADEPLRRAVAGGIPLVTVDSGDPRPRDQRIPYLQLIGNDNGLAGRAAAERILAERKPKRAACPIHEAGNTGLEARCQGFIEVMKAAGVPVDKFEISATNPTEATETVRSYFKSHPDTDAIMTMGPPPGQEVITALDEQKLTGKVMHVGNVLTPELLQAVIDGKLLALIDFQPYLQGYLAVVNTALYVRHGLIPNNDTYVSGGVVDKSNAAQAKAGVEAGIR